MTDLAAFLLARYADEQMRANDKWQRPHWGNCNTQGDQSSLGDECDCGLPSRVLAECEARRRIVANERAARKAMGEAPLEQLLAAQDGPASAYWRGQDFALRLLAAVYSDHPDFDPSWRL